MFDIRVFKMVLDLKKETISSLRKMLLSREISALELTESALDVAGKNDCNSFITVTRDHALRCARESDKRIASGESKPLDGIPCGIKDIFCTKGILTTCASKMLYNFIPPYESTVTRLLGEAGAVMIGKVNMDEFAMGSSSTNSFFGPCINPWVDKRDPQKKLVPGGSSGGSVVCVVEGSGVFSIGTDTGGSVRQPASFCGVVGIKPSYGLCSRYGMISYSSSMDTAGVFARSVDGAAEVLDVIRGFDKADSTSIPDRLVPFGKFGSKIGRDIAGMKIGIPKEYEVDGLDPDIKQLWFDSARKLERLGAEVISISLPHAKNGIEIYYIITTAEASSNLSRYDGIKYGYSVNGQGRKSLEDLYFQSRGDGFGPEVKRRIILGTFVLASENYEDYFVKATRIRRLVKNDFQNAFQQVDAILCPTTPNVAFGVNEKISDPILMYLNDIFTVPVNLSGLPAMSVPVGFGKDNGLPIGMQIIGDYMEDDKMIQIGNALMS